MSKNNNPIILLVFANDKQADLEGIREETQNLRTLLEKDSYIKDNFEVKLIPFTTRDLLLDDLREHRNQIACLHFAGHSNSEVWRLDDGDLQSKLLADFLKQQNTIRFLFLNGCKNKAQVEAFKEAGIPAVIATSRPIEDNLANSFSSEFYKSLISQEGATSILTAYEEAKAVANKGEAGSNRDAATHREIDLEDIKHSQDKGEDWAWELYFDADKEVEKTLKDILFEITQDPLINYPLPNDLPKPKEPFIGLRPFTRKESRIFFGREAGIANLISRISKESVDAEPIVLFYGQSGVGKSSLLHAGVLPRLEKHYDIRYKARETTGLLATLKQALNSNGNSLIEAWQEQEKASQKPTVIILDQLEEAYTQHNTEQGNQEVTGLATALRAVFLSENKPQGALPIISC